MADSNKSPFTFAPTTTPAPSPFAASAAGNQNKAPGTSLFSSNPAPGIGLFGAKPSDPQNKPAAPSLFGGFNTTPAGPKSFTLGSTTPAATPPSSNPQLASTLPGTTTASTGLFANLGKPAAAAAASTSAQPVSASTSTDSSIKPPTPSLFSTTPSSKPAETPSAGTSLFSLGSKPVTTGSATPSSTLFSAPAAPAAGTSLFASSPKPAPANPVASASSNQSLSSAGGGGLFSNLSKSATATTTATAVSAKPADNAVPVASSSAAPSNPTPTSSLFAKSGVSQNSVQANGTNPSSAATSSLFAASKSPAVPTGSLNNAAAASTANVTSPAGPQPSTAGRLKNRSMDEILTRWANELSKHQKQFQQQAEQVAGWDRSLVENADKISKLVGKTLQAERDATEIERQLSSVESQQEDLEQWLSKYEKEADDMIAKAGLTGTSTGTDLEREHTFKTAEKLTDKLEGLNKDLSDVIEEINTVSALLNNTKGAEDPLSNVVRVLNSHLMQLQKIDVDASALQAKVKDVQKSRQVLGGSDWRGASDPAEDFYRSFSRK